MGVPLARCCSVEYRAGPKEARPGIDLRCFPELRALADGQKVVLDVQGGGEGRSRVGGQKFRGIESQKWGSRSLSSYRQSDGQPLYSQDSSPLQNLASEEWTIGALQELELDLRLLEGSFKFKTFQSYDKDSSLGMSSLRLMPGSVYININVILPEFPSNCEASTDANDAETTQRVGTMKRFGRGMRLWKTPHRQVAPSSDFAFENSTLLRVGRTLFRAYIALLAQLKSPSSTALAKYSDSRSQRRGGAFCHHFQTPTLAWRTAELLNTPGPTGIRVQM
ncbi:hypothetical protein DFH08DRAFT_944241 [Mycena albidolilacea]|uniref:Uncharacterized protein n=1 Tax=Mycena albidolilacea TaxID=1033008 RepID=A0AAD6Z6K9_9AGAR|nr:hypothetical protein DFH08DRAFT_944241 [Mycena albidolilacea]